MLLRAFLLSRAGVGFVATGCLATGACGMTALSSGGAGDLRAVEQRVQQLEAAQRRRPVVICGPSGVGKGTLIGRLMKDHPDEFGFSVSHTTRAPRVGEEHGVHYYFCDRAAMEAAIARGEFVETAHVHKNIYGTSVASVKEIASTGKTCILDIDVQGADSVKKTDLNARFLFIAPPEMGVLEKRLRGRNTETEESLQLRLVGARREMSYAQKPGYFEKIIVNDDLEVAYREFEAAMRIGRE